MRTFIAATLLLAALPLSAAPTSGTNVLPKGTPVRLRLENDLRSGRDKVGEPVLFTVAQDVYSPNHVLLIPQGAIAHGHVTASSGRGAFSRNGRLSFTGDYATAAGGVRVPLTFTVTVENGRTEDTAIGIVGGSYTAGKVYDSYNGTDAPGGTFESSVVTADAAVDAGRLLAKGDDATANQGRVYETVVAADTPVTSPPAQAAASEQLFLLRNKTQITGTLVSFDGKTYTVETAAGSKILPAADVESIASGAAPSPR